MKKKRRIQIRRAKAHVISMLGEFAYTCCQNQVQPNFIYFPYLANKRILNRNKPDLDRLTITKPGLGYNFLNSEN